MTTEVMVAPAQQKKLKVLAARKECNSFDNHRSWKADPILIECQVKLQARPAVSATQEARGKGLVQPHSNSYLQELSVVVRDT